MNSTLKKRRHGNRQKETWRFENALFPKGLAFGEHGSSPVSRTISTDNRCCKRAHQKWWVRFSLCKNRPDAALIPRTPQEYTVGPATWAGFFYKFFGSGTPGFQFPWIFPDLPCTACTACNPCNSCTACNHRSHIALFSVPCALNPCHHSSGVA